MEKECGAILYKLYTLKQELQKKYTVGTVIHFFVFVWERIENTEALKNFVRKVCPIYGSRTEVYSKVVGYLRPVHRWNEGKRHVCILGLKKEMGYRIKLDTNKRRTCGLCSQCKPKGHTKEYKCHYVLWHRSKQVEHCPYISPPIQKVSFPQWLER